MVYAHIKRAVNAMMDAKHKPAAFCPFSPVTPSAVKNEKMIAMIKTT
jgi:hypothetical protein